MARRGVPLLALAGLLLALAGRPTAAQTPKFLRAHQVKTPDWSYYHTTAQLVALIEAYAVPGPSSPFRVPVFAARTLNATGQSRVTLSLR